MKLGAHEQPLVFVKDVLSGTVQAEAVWGANYYSAHKFERFPSLVLSFDLATMIR